MLELYRLIQKHEPGQQGKIITLLDEENMGEKAYWEGNTCCWMSKKAGYFSSCSIDLSGLNTGIQYLNNKKVFIESLGGRKKLVICGAGHVSMSIITLGKMLGFWVVVLEDRPYFADQARKTGADQVICDEFSHGLEQIIGDEDTYFVVVTRGHRFDKCCLKEIFGKKYCYVGMMGSRKRVVLLKESLRQEGISAEKLEELHAPIGLSIGAQSPEEIAVSIAAELIQIKNEQKREESYEEELLDEILEGRPGRQVLATIIEKKGSAPRKPGTKMLIRENGSCFGTIGGGCMEAEVIAKARSMRKGPCKSELFCADMTGLEAEEEGMVCGGTVEVLLEIL